MANKAIIVHCKRRTIHSTEDEDLSFSIEPDTSSDKSIFLAAINYILDKYVYVPDTERPMSITIRGSKIMLRFSREHVDVITFRPNYPWRGELLCAKFEEDGSITHYGRSPYDWFGRHVDSKGNPIE